MSKTTRTTRTWWRGTVILIILITTTPQPTQQSKSQSRQSPNNNNDMNNNNNNMNMTTNKGVGVGGTKGGGFGAIIVAETVTCILNSTIQGLFKYASPTPSHIHIVLPSSQIQDCKTKLIPPKPKKIICHQDHKVLPVTTREMGYYFKQKGNTFENLIPRSSWYLRQLIKLLSILSLQSSLSPHYLLWDANNILYQRYEYYRSGKMRVNTGGFEDPKPYEKTTLNLIGTIAPKKDILTSQVVIKKSILMEMLEHICGKNIRPGNCAFLILGKLQVTDPRKAFSAHHLYLSWIYDKYPKYVNDKKPAPIA
eukprot:CAMPEP_0201483140 /NCGR_PEP_ID=MMETSP0151_2-20130828/7368_1 /ASSEMBLY_ACC=CAM_ASM_000257 /TAXON_ID=200890 /ORGANISM="Paramoeba atlantica, Strain 621/1 / CCAP 1560/9" /LENGTH=308 /DNA_ID=CAMNT_0047866145 /DNA_START=78 /DNA_END=1001 /DNA_ORIENTATION=+